MKTNDKSSYAFVPNFSGNEAHVLKRHPIQPNSPSIIKLGTLNTKYSRHVKYDLKPQKGANNVRLIKAYYGNLIIENVGKKIYFDEKVSKIFSLCLIKYHQTHNPYIELSLSRYKELTKIKDSKTARMDLMTAINSLVHITISLSNIDELNSRQQKLEPFLYAENLFSRGGYGSKGHCKRGTGFLELTPAFAKALDNSTTPRIYPRILFALRGMSFYLLNALINNKQINYMDPNNRGNRMKMKTLLRQCPNLPEWQNIKNRNYTARIVDPLAKAIGLLGDLCKIKFCYLTYEGNSRESIYNLPLENFLENQIVVVNWGNINVEQVGSIRKKAKKFKERSVKRKSEHKK